MSNFWRTLEICLINCKINFILSWLANCFITNSASAEIFAIAGTNLYVLAATSSSPDNVKVLQILKLVFKRINCQPKVITQAQNQYSDYLIDLIFLEVNRLFVLSFEDNPVRTGHTRYFLPKVEIKDHIIFLFR